MAATLSIPRSYFHAIPTSFNKCRKLVRDQGVGGSNPLSPTIIFNHLQTIHPDPLVSAQMPWHRKARHYWVSRRISNATPSTKTSAVGRDDPVILPMGQTGYAIHLSDSATYRYFGEGHLHRFSKKESADRDLAYRLRNKSVARVRSNSRNPGNPCADRFGQYKAFAIDLFLRIRIS
jgi:hypothetical protein